MKTLLTGLVLAALPAVPAASFAAEVQATEIHAAAAPAEARTADVQVRIPAVPSAMPHEALRRAEIFRILQGGTSVTDAALAEHLWAVAGSLAQTGWTPPRVTVRVVVKDADTRD